MKKRNAQTGTGTMVADKLNRTDKLSSTDNFYVIGIGASAGGLEALKEFFDHVPQDIPHSFVVIQHLSPDYKSLMTELLAKNTQLPIHEVANDMDIQAGSIYLIPAKKNMTIRGKKLFLVDKPTSHDLNLPIDIFFNSLAEDQGSRAIGVILSGTGSDGTRGLLSIKEAGGMAMVQNPETAKFNGMPKSAVATGLIDYVLSIDQMPGEILNYISYPKLEHSQFDKILMKDEDTVMRILIHIKNFTSLDFTSYKRPTLIRRISRRMTVNNCSSANEYLKFLLENATETKILYKEFLIGVTRFFRDAEAFEVLAKKVIPDILKNAKPKQPVKVWSVGCCTGEEAYSIAILFKEGMEKLKKHVDIKIFATDLDTSSIDKASKGVYEESNVGDISAERLKKYFVKKGSTYQIIQEIRKMIIFSHHNVLQDPPFNKMDFVCTRNMMIYLEPSMQKRMLTTLHYALNLNGYLCLGASETVGDFKKVFEEVDRRWKVYRNKEAARTINFDEFKNSGSKNLLAGGGMGRGSAFVHRASVENKLSEILNEALTEELGCASVYVDDGLNIVHAYGNLHSYITLPEKGFSVNLQKMLPDSVVVAINTSIRKANKENLDSVYKGIRIRQGNKIRKIVVLVKPFKMDTHDIKKYYLIIFFEHSLEDLANKKVKDFTVNPKSNSLITDLEQELKETKENLQLTIEELETSNEEMQATNEEIMAANEELQSTNEELQSVNEELHTVNAEHQEKIRELDQLNGDMDNFLKSTEIGTIFLDKYQRIRSFTPAIIDQFNLLPSDIGRPISNFTNNLGNVNIVEDASRVLETGIQIEKEVMGGNKWYLMRLLPYKSDNKTDGVVITFVDITSLVIIKKELVESQRSFDSFMEYSPLLTWIKNEDGKYIYANKAFEKHFNISRDKLVGKTDETIFPVETAKKLKAAVKILLEAWKADVTMEKRMHGNEVYTYHTIMFPFVGSDDKRYVGGISQDITYQVKTEEALRLNEARSKAMLKAIPDMMIRTDDQGKILSIEQNEVNAGIKIAQDKAINKYISEVFTEDVAMLHHQSLQKVFKTKKYLHYAYEIKADKAPSKHFDVRLVKSNENEAIFIIRDITDFKNTRASIISAIIEGEEKERRRVAQELHDGLGQIISALRLQVTYASKKINGNHKLLDKSIELIADAVSEYRAISHNLLPPILENSSLPEVLKALCSRVDASDSCKATFKDKGLKSKQDKIVIRELYRITQELISNSVKHSGCSNILVELSEYNGHIHLDFSDNGIGFEPGESRKNATGIGLKNLYTRTELLGGEIRFISEKGKGTRVSLSVPVHPKLNGISRLQLGKIAGNGI
ncbi:MAG: PAS domain-containing protein [Bacteroidetes bacterium]|nr:PAS domain-containing protein [Bacteroidota bacterium]